MSLGQCADAGVVGVGGSCDHRDWTPRYGGGRVCVRDCGDGAVDYCLGLWGRQQGLDAGRGLEWRTRPRRCHLSALKLKCKRE